MNAQAMVHQKVEAYLKERRQAGFAMRVIGSQLRSFARFAEERGHRGPITRSLALEWAQTSKRLTGKTAAGRLEQLRSFLLFCHQLDPASEVVCENVFGPSYRRVTPHIYSPREVRSLIEAASCLRPAGGLRPHTYGVFFGLLASTGLRLSEALHLERRDVDLKRGVLHIREAKLNRARDVPLHATTIRALQRYTQRRDRDAASGASSLFFLSDHGRPLHANTVGATFDRLRLTLGWRCRGGRPAPRIHDLRFTFICRRIERWCEQGRDVDNLMLSLYTYVGHAKATSTYWYLTATPELMRFAARRFHTAQCGGGV